MSKSKTGSATRTKAATTKTATKPGDGKAAGLRAGKAAPVPTTKSASARAADVAQKPGTKPAARTTAAAGRAVTAAKRTATPAKPTAAAAKRAVPPARRTTAPRRAAKARVAKAGVARPDREAVPADASTARGGEFKFQVSDGLRLHYKVWRPDVAPRRLVILVHGFADHSDRFSYLVPHLLERGAVVYAYDQRGQGRSPGRTGHVMKFQRLVDDLETFVRLACEREAGIPHFIYAHSTGAIAALHYLYAMPLAVDGAVLSAPCLMLTFEPPGWKATLGKTISSVVPSFTMQAGFDPGMVSRDQEVVAANKTDALVSQKMTARFYTEVYLKAMPSALARIDQLKTPYLVVQGTEDRLVSPRVADEFERRAAVHGTVKRYQGGYHESHNDIHRDQVFADVDEWLEAYDPKPKRARR